MKSTDNSQPEPSPNLSAASSKSESLSFKQIPTFWKRLGLGLTIGVAGSAIAFLGIRYKIQQDFPASVEDVVTYARPHTLTIKAADNTVIKEIGNVSHDKITLKQIPPIIYQAFIASEDKRFYQHKGVDAQGIARATWTNLKTGGVVEGGSTITQQLARIAYLSQEKSLWRKLKEVEISRQIEQNLTKEQILETYLNLVYLGSGSYGIADAAWVYFGKKPQDLTVPEVATLAGIVPAPSVYSPFNNWDLAKKRRNIVLHRMAEAGYITPEVADNAINSPMITNRQQPKRLQRQAQYFTNYIQEELPKYVSPEVLAEGGIVVETSLDPTWQKAAETTVNYGLDQYGKWQKFQQAALVALDPSTGEIKALVGGRDFGDNQYNRVTQAQRQPGSTFKTFVYTSAIAAGFSPYKTYLDSELYVDGYQPKNYQATYRGTEVSLYNALASSINTVALQTTIDVGWNPIIKVAQKMGIKSPLQPTYSLALGAWEVNLLELTNAYGTLANQGVYQQGHGITRIRDRNGKVIYEAKFTPVTAVDKDTAAIMTWMLQGVVNGGTGIPAQIGRPSAGKTGTSDEARDLWYIGYIPQVTTGIWLGNDDNQPTNGTSGVAAEMWRKFMLEVTKELPVENFPTLPQLNGRKGEISPDPIKPKRRYYIHKAQAAPTYRTYSPPRRQRRYAPPRRTYRPPVYSAPAAKPTAPAPTKTITPAPTATTPQISKPSKATTPATPERDWVKERLGRE